MPVFESHSRRGLADRPNAAPPPALSLAKALFPKMKMGEMRFTQLSGKERLRAANLPNGTRTEKAR
jgi:hypothetical protein